LRWIRDPGADAERLTAINGSLAWTAPTAPARANITAIFRGEQMTLNGSTSAPLLFLGKTVWRRSRSGWFRRR
jgi:AsmA protein